ncbi:4-hydroxy-3-methylbut-2-en-1-yl diphosphate synthase, partial [Nannochloropsis gaditana]
PSGLQDRRGACPSKDIATSDSLFLRQPPPVDDKEGRAALRRLQESGLGLLSPASTLTATPVPNAIAVYDLAASLPRPSLPPSPGGSLRRHALGEGDGGGTQETKGSFTGDGALGDRSVLEPRACVEAVDGVDRARGPELSRHPPLHFGGREGGKDGGREGRRGEYEDALVT